MNYSYEIVSNYTVFWSTIFDLRYFCVPGSVVVSTACPAIQTHADEVAYNYSVSGIFTQMNINVKHDLSKNKFHMSISALLRILSLLRLSK